MSSKRKRPSRSGRTTSPQRPRPAASGVDAVLAAARELPVVRPPTPPTQAVQVPDGPAAAPVVLGDQAPATTGRVQVTSMSCASLRNVEPQSLGLTCWYDAAEDGEPMDVAVRFEGRRLDGPPSTLPKQFGTEATVVQVPPGSGRAALTTRVAGIAPGSWEVRAMQVRPQRLTPSAPVQGETAFAPVVRVSGPGVALGAWPALVLLGTALALIVQNRLATRTELPAGRVLALTALACLIGVVGAKMYCLLTHRGERLDVVGMSVQGFVLGAVGTLAVGSLLSGLNVGRMLDVTAPGLLFGMTVGRFGCLLGGCCAGRLTASRWGVRSSDRRLLARRIPVQLLEGAVAAVAGVTALLMILAGRDEPAGALFAGTLAAYTLGRQLLFPLRNIPRRSRHGRTVMILSATVLVIFSAASLA